MFRIIIHNYYNNNNGIFSELDSADDKISSSARGRSPSTQSLDSMKGCAASLYAVGDDIVCVLSLDKVWTEEQRIKFITSFSSNLKRSPTKGPPLGLTINAVTCADSDCTGRVDFTPFFREVKKIARTIATIEVETNDNREQSAEHKTNRDGLADLLSSKIFPAVTITQPSTTIKENIQHFAQAYNAALQSISASMLRS